MTSRSEMASRLASASAGLRQMATPAGRVCEAARILAGADGASVTLLQADGGIERVVLSSTGDGAARLEEIHDALGEGPAFDALHDDTVVEASTSEMVRRWPLFAGLVERDVPLSRISAFPMHADGDSFGVLVLYLARPGAYSYGRQDLAMLADIAAVMLLSQAPVDELAGASAWEDRSTINRATGMVMAQLGLAPPDALAVMRAHAYAVDATLPVVAGEILSRTLTFQPPDEPEPPAPPT